MELHLTPKKQIVISEAKITAAGLSSQKQLVEITTPLEIIVDQTANGSPLFVFKPEEVISRQSFISPTKLPSDISRQLELLLP